MPADAWITAAVLIAAVVLMATDRAPTIVVMGSAVLALLFADVIDQDQALSGLGDDAPATIAALYVLAGAAAITGALGGVVDRIMRGRSDVTRLAASTAGLSAFVPNTPLVALFAPRVVRWSRRTGIPASRLLMPLSFASVLGGVVTVIGTSTNLVVSGVLRQAGEDPLGMFEITPVGLPVAVAGVAALAVLAPRLLPERTSPGESENSARQYQVVMAVVAGGPLVGRTVEEAGLRNLSGVFLAAIRRHDEVVGVGPTTVLAEGDSCVFVGDVSRIVDLHDLEGLRSEEQPHLSDAEGRDRRLYEAVVGDRSDLAGSTLKHVGFRGRYGAAVLAIHRADGKLTGKLGTIELRPGDVLLVLGGPEFEDVWRAHHDFALVAPLSEPPPPRRNKALLVTLAFIGMVVLAATEVLSLLEAAVAAAVAVVVGGAVSLGEAGRSISIDVVLTIAASISLGEAVRASGLATEIASAVDTVAGPAGEIGQLVAVLLVTMLLTELLSNNAAAAVMVPVAMLAATSAGSDPRPFAVAVLIGASCSFLSPVGYQTNLMVYGLGGYRYTDFFRLGFPITVITAIVTTCAIGIFML